MNTVAIASSAVLADLDETLRRLLRSELSAAGIGEVTITFEAPSRERTATWPSPALNLFLYDVREATIRDRSWHRDPAGHDVQGPLRLACTFAITAWTQAVEDEHRLLSQVLAVLLAYPELPPDVLEPGLLVGAPPASLPARVAQPKEDGRADFWTAIGSPYKVSLEYMVTVFCAVGLQRPRAPLARAVGVDTRRRR